MPTEKLEPHIPILTAESAPWSVASLKRLFTEYQMSNVSFVDDAYKTLHKGRFEKYSLILVSDGLDKGDSLKVISQIRSDGKNKNIPIIFMSQDGDDQTVEKAAASGASATVKKPVEERALREAIEEVLDKYILTVTLMNEKDQENENATMSEVEKGQKLLSLGDFEGAETAFEEAMMTGGGSPDVFCGLAEVYLARGDKEAAEQVLGEAVRIDPMAQEKFDSRNLGLIQKAKQFLADKKLDEAEDSFNEALLKGGEIFDVYAGLAEVHLRKNDKEAAERAIAEAEKIDPDVRERFKKLESELVDKGDEKYTEGELENAKEAYECAVVVNDKSVAANVGLGQTLHDMGDQEGSDAAFKKAVESDERPKDLHVYNKMGIVARKEKNFELAVDSYDRALFFNPFDSVLFYNKAMVYVAQSDFDGCLEHLDKALEYNPDFLEAKEVRKKLQKMMKK